MDQAAGCLSAAGDRQRSHGSEEKSSCSLATLYHNPPIALPILVLNISPLTQCVDIDLVSHEGWLLRTATSHHHTTLKVSQWDTRGLCN